MYIDDINWVAVLIVAILNIILGMLWYSPQVFGRVWMDLIKLPETKPTAGHYVGALIVALISAWVLALFINWLDITTVAEGAKLGFYVWLGFVATTHFSGVLWAGKPLKAYLIDAGFYLVNFIIMGGILAAWQ